MGDVERTPNQIIKDSWLSKTNIDNKFKFLEYYFNFMDERKVQVTAIERYRLFDQNKQKITVTVKAIKELPDDTGKWLQNEINPMLILKDIGSMTMLINNKAGIKQLEQFLNSKVEGEG